MNKKFLPQFLTRQRLKVAFIAGLFSVVGFGFAGRALAANLPSKWFGSYGVQTNTTSVRYISPFGGDQPQSSEINALQLTPSSGTVQNLRVQLDAAPGNGKSYAITFREELADTALTCTVTGLASSCSDTT